MQKNRKQPQHILLYRCSALGDVVMITHALRSLRGAYPHLCITVATRKGHRSQFEGLCDNFLEVDTKGEHRGIKGMWRLASQIKALGVDRVADLHDVLRSQILRKFLRFKGIVVAHIDKGRSEKRALVKSGVSDSTEWLKHSVVRYCDVIRQLGLQITDPEPAPRSMRVNPMGEKSGVWIGFAPFSAHEGKRYPLDLTREAVELLAKRYDRVFLLSGGGTEAERSKELEAQISGVTALWGRVTPSEELDLISNMDCVVTMDSLVMHLASMCATPVVSVWGATHPALGFMGYGYSDENILMSEMECRPCSVFGNKPCKWGDFRCMRSLPAERIVERVVQIVG